VYYQVNSQVPFTGILTIMHSAGGSVPPKVAVVANFKGGKLHGILKEYYRSGQLMLDMMFANGDGQGLCKRYYPNGQLMVQATLSARTLNGVLSCYEPNGAISMKATFARDTMSGLAVRWRPRTSGSTIAYGEIGDIVADSGNFRKGGGSSGREVAIGEWKTSENQDRGGPGVVFRGNLDANGRPIGIWTMSLGQSLIPFARVMCADGPDNPNTGPVHIIDKLDPAQGITLVQAQDLARKLHPGLGSSIAQTFWFGRCSTGNQIVHALISDSETVLP
jgi:hypothetical protein